MKTPEYLKKGDKIAIVAPARKISLKEIEPAVSKFKEWGLEVVFANHLFSQYNQFAGIDELRTLDFQQMLDDDSIKAIVCARGGYGTVRIVDNLNFMNFIKRPKWIVGYSDVTVLHSHINKNFGVETIHGIMPINFPDDGYDNESLEILRKLLFGENISYKVKTSKLSRKGKAVGMLVGGNLSVLYSLIGSNSDVDTEGKILFIEDLDEYLYHIDRMMMNLKRAGKLDKLKGMIVGGMNDMNDNDIPFGKTANEIVAEAIKQFDYPVCFDFPAGHIKDNRALILGRTIKLNVGDDYTNIEYVGESEPRHRKIKKMLITYIFLIAVFLGLYLLYVFVLNKVL